MRSSAEIRAGITHLQKPEGSYAGWKAMEVTFEVNPRSPHEFTIAPLNIEVTEP
jgi:hypothetical protein